MIIEVALKNDDGAYLAIDSCEEGIYLVTSAAYRFSRPEWIRFIAARAAELLAPSMRELVDQVRREDPSFPEVPW